MEKERRIGGGISLYESTWRNINKLSKELGVSKAKIMSPYLDNVFSDSAIELKQEEENEEAYRTEEEKLNT